MTVTIDSIARISETMARVDYSSSETDPTFYIWVNGELIDTTSDTYRMMFAAPGGYSDLDIFDDSGDVPGEYYPDSITLQWVTHGGVTNWVVTMRTTEGGDPTTVRTMVDNDGVMTCEIGGLDDDQDYWFAVTGYNSNGVAATARDFFLHYVRRPDLTEGVITYDAGTGELTISEAA